LGENKTLIKPLVLVFGSRYLLEKKEIYQEIREIFKDGEIVFGSSAGDISAHSVDDDGITITAIEFEKSSFEIKTVNVKNQNQAVNSFQAGYELIQQFDQENLKYVLVISDGSV
ncbi:histidine kinase, partial [Polaribacter sp. BAL334]|uniref:FIST N-terminal domain-containing protein n=1 Tax=Polaribacter sp. BAL334 TaxID=1708178 RepID=UPI001A2B4F9D